MADEWIEETIESPNEGVIEEVIEDPDLLYINPYLRRNRTFDIECILFKRMTDAMEMRNMTTDAIREKIGTYSGPIGIMSTTDIISYNVDSSFSGKGLCVGDVVSANYSIIITKGAFEKYLSMDISLLSEYVCVVRIGILNHDNYIWKDFGLWYIDSVDINYHDTTATIRGVDALARNGDMRVDDQQTYTSATTWGDVFLNIAKFVYRGSVMPESPKYDLDFFTANDTMYPSGITVSGGRIRPWWTLPENSGTLDDTSYGTIRSIVSTIASYAAGYAYIDFKGQLVIKTFSDENKYEDLIDEYHISNITFDATLYKCEDVMYEYVSSYSYSSSSKKYSSVKTETYSEGSSIYYSNCPDIAYIDTPFPIFKQYVKSEELYKKLESCGTIYGGSITFIGDPSITLGQLISVEYTGQNKTVREINMLASSISYEFNSGLSCTITSSMPTQVDRNEKRDERVESWVTLYD